MVEIEYIRMDRDELQEEKRYLEGQLNTLETLQQEEWEYRQRLEDIEFLLGGDQ